MYPYLRSVRNFPPLHRKREITTLIVVMCGHQRQSFRCRPVKQDKSEENTILSVKRTDADKLK